MSVMPDHVRDWLAVNDDVPAKQMKCPVCGEWYASIDQLAPYHFETCWCAKCQTYPRRPSDDAPRSNSVISDQAGKTKGANGLDKTT